MKLNLAKKKELSAKNIQDIVRIGVNFGEKINQITEKCVEDYSEDTLYSPKMLCIYDNYIWECKYSTQGAFDNTKWTKLTDELSLIDLDTIKSMIGLTSEEITTLQSILNDAEIRLDKTHSSSKIFSDMQDILSQSKTFTMQQFAKANKASYHVVSATSEMTDKSVIYLMPNSTNYDMYIVESDGTPTKIGDTKIDLSQFYTKTEIDNDFVKKTDADGKYATITTVDGKVDKTSILTTISTTATNKQAYGASVINTELDKKFDKDNILSIIQDTDNSKVFGAKAVYDTFNQKADKINLYEIKEGEKSKHIVIDLPASHSISGKTTRLFVSDNILAIGLQIWNGAILEKDFRTPLINSNHIFIPTKALTPVSANVNFTNVDSSCNYTVINGMCYVNIWSMNITSNLSVETIFNNLPRAKVSAQFILSNADGSKTVGMGWIGIGTQIIQCNVKLEDGTIKSQGYTRFSYPIDETWIPS